MADMIDVATLLLEKQAEIISLNPSVAEAVAAKENYASSVTVRVNNFLKHTLIPLQASTRAGEIEVAADDVVSLSQSALLAYRITRPPSRSGCAGTLNFRIEGLKNHNLHIMWTSPNNFDKLASHLAVGVSQERTDKFNDMYYNKQSWFCRKYVYHDKQGLWFATDEVVIYAKSSTKPVSDVEVYIFPADPNDLPNSLKEVAKSLM